MSVNFTTANLKVLEDAIASGVLRVEYNDRTVVYRKMDDMLKTRTLIRRSLGLEKKGGGRILCESSKGTV